MYNVIFFKNGVENEEPVDSEEYGTLAEAEAKYNNPDFYWRSCRYVMLDGPNINKSHKNPNYAESDPDEWRREQRTQAAMMHGIHGLNDYD